MGYFAEARRKDGRVFQQWRRSHKDELMPSFGLGEVNTACPICGAEFYDKRGVAPARIVAGRIVEPEREWVRSEVEHDYLMHATHEGNPSVGAEAQEAVHRQRESARRDRPSYGGRND